MKRLVRSSIRKRWVRCGKKGCTQCPHGPYLYRVWRESGKTREEYLGREDGRPAYNHPVAQVLPEGRSEQDLGLHPYKVGTQVRFLPDRLACWVSDNRAYTSTPPLKVTAIGFSRFGLSHQVYPYVVLETLEGKAVFHPYDSTFTFADSAGRLDRRFPVPLVEPLPF